MKNNFLHTVWIYAAGGMWIHHSWEWNDEDHWEALSAKTRKSWFGEGWAASILVMFIVTWEVFLTPSGTQQPSTPLDEKQVFQTEFQTLAVNVTALKDALVSKKELKPILMLLCKTISCRLTKAISKETHFNPSCLVRCAWALLYVFGLKRSEVCWCLNIHSICG